MQMSERIGNIDDRLIEQAEKFGTGNSESRGSRGGRKKRMLRRLLAAAAVAALMTGSFVLGAFALNDEPDTIEIEGAGISLLLPDSWKGKYVWEQSGDGIVVYEKTLHAENDKMGMLFFVDKTEGNLPVDYSYPMPGYTIASVDGYTYFLAMASDVEYYPEDEKTAERYLSLYRTIEDIRIILSDWMKENSINQTNREEGTVYVDLLNAWEGTVKESIICDRTASEKINQLIARQTFNLEQVNFETPADIVIRSRGDEFWIESRTGKIDGNLDEMSGTVLSEEDRKELISLIENQKKAVDEG